ncbi:unnamed protein product [Angiostrongylus costaricensis]|uniref:Segment polarity protein dishevelled-like protein DVL-3 n=1 Tax=Angiostrongylus costaricensis TaxID=334426 RepID=A0A0R3PD10_ANGCS|nr:unnamed protein product [Angiostrongylus costaricensis]
MSGASKPKDGLANTDFSQSVETSFPQATETKVYYYLDDDTTPFVSILPVPPELATLKDFKKVFTKKGFKYFCKGLDADIKREVKIELVDDSALLKRSSNGLFEIFLHSCGGVGVARSGTLPRRGQADYMCDLDVLDKDVLVNISPNYTLQTLRISTSMKSQLGIPLCANGAYNDVGKVRRRKPRKERFRKAYVPSTISSITESSMTSLSLPRILEVNLSMRTTPYLGISVGSFQGSILVSEILPDGAVAKDGRIEVGDQIVQVNNRSFENLTEAQAVRLLREVAAAKKWVTHPDFFLALLFVRQCVRFVEGKAPLVLFVAKYSRGNDYDPLSSLASETLPLDVSLWVQTAAYVLQYHNYRIFTDERALYAQRRHGIPHHNIEELERRRENEQNEHKAAQRLSVAMDPVVILRALARPDSGLQVKNRKWLKILVPMSFIGRDLVDWLLEHVEDLSDRKAARQYAAELLRAGLIRHVVSKLTFTEKCYYVFGDAIVGVRGGADSTQNSGGTLKVEATTEVTYVGSPAPTGQRDVLYDFVSRP